MDIKLFRQRIQDAKKIMEDAMCADLAPYPVLPVSVVKVTKKKEAKDERKEKPDSKPV